MHRHQRRDASDKKEFRRLVQSVHNNSDAVGSDSDSGEPRPHSNRNDSSKKYQTNKNGHEKIYRSQGGFGTVKLGLGTVKLGPGTVKLGPGTVKYCLEPLSPKSPILNAEFRSLALPTATVHNEHPGRLPPGNAARSVEPVSESPY